MPATVQLDYPAAEILHLSNAAAGPLDPSTLTPVFVLDPDAMSAGAVASVASGGTAGAFAQGTAGARPTVVAAVLDGRKSLRFDGGDSLTSPTGANNLSGEFTVIEVRRHTAGLSSHQEGVSWGDATSRERRGPNHKRDNGVLGWVGEGADSDGTQVVTSDSWYALVTTYATGTGFVSQYVNGLLVKSAAPSATLLPYTSTAINLGCNTAGGENLTGDLLYAAAIPSALSPDQVAGVFAFLAARFPSVEIAGNGSYLPITYSEDGAAIGATVTSFDAATGRFILGPGPTITTYDTVGTSSYTPAFSVRGGFAADATSQGHQFRAWWANQNVLHLVNTSPTGFSAVTTGYPGPTGGKEMNAFGTAPPNTFPWGGPNASTYLEFSNFNNTSLWGDYREVQTLFVTRAIRRRVRDDTRANEEYDLTATEPSVNGPTVGLVKLNGRPVTAVANDGTLDTNITTGTTQCGLVVVKDATSSRCAVYRLENTTLTIVSANAIFSTTINNAGTINVYANSGQIRLQNRTGGALNLTAAYYGA